MPTTQEEATATIQENGKAVAQSFQNGLKGCQEMGMQAVETMQEYGSVAMAMLRDMAALRPGKMNEMEGQINGIVQRAIADNGKFWETWARTAEQVRSPLTQIKFPGIPFKMG